MAIVKQTVPYEILIRFGFAGEHQGVGPGEFSGAHYLTADLIVDDATGLAIAPPAVGLPQAVPQDKLAALVGEQMAAINAGVDAMQAAAGARVAAAEGRADAANGRAAELEAKIAELTAMIEAAR